MMIQNTFMLPIVKIVAIAPVTMITSLSASNANYQITLSAFILFIQISLFYLYNKVFILRFPNNIVTWAQPRHFSVFLDKSSGIILVVTAT